MPLKHTDIWRAIDRLAELGASPSGLALVAKLSPDRFQPQQTRFEKPQALAFDRKHRQDIAGHRHDARRICRPDLRRKIRARDLAAYEPHPGETRRGVRRGGVRRDAAGKISIFRLSPIRMPSRWKFPAGVWNLPIAKAPALFSRYVKVPRRGDRVVMRIHKGDLSIGELGRENAQKIELLPLNPGHPAVSRAARDRMDLQDCVGEPMTGTRLTP